MAMIPTAGMKETKPLGLFQRLANNPGKANMILMGLGLLGSKKRSQADKYISGISGSLLDQAKANREGPGREADIRLKGSQAGLAEAQAGQYDNASFLGTGITAQAMNTISRLGAKIQAGGKLEYREQLAYRAAQEYLQRPTQFTTPQGTLAQQPGMGLDYLPEIGSGAPDPAAPPGAPVPQGMPPEIPAPGGPATPSPVASGPGMGNVPGLTILEQAPTAQVLAKRENIKKMDANMAATASDWVEGGYSKTQSNLGQLGGALSSLMGGDTTTGGWESIADIVIPDKAMALLAPQFVQTKETVQEVAQQSLKEILGAQFGIREGEQLIARAYNPQIPTEYNVKRVQRLMKRIASAADAKNKAVEHYLKHNTMEGYKGDIPTLSDWTDPAKLDKMFADLSPEGKDIPIPQGAPPRPPGAKPGQTFWIDPAGKEHFY